MKHLQHLQAEKLRLKKEVAGRKQKLQEMSEQLSDQAGRMAVNSLLPFDSDQRQKLNDAFDSLNNTASRLFNSAGSAAKPSLALKSIQMLAAGLAWRYFRKWIKKS